MILTDKEQIQEIILSERLEFRETSKDTRRWGEDDMVLEKPVVTIGMPLSWNIAEVYNLEKKQLPATIQLLMKEANFYLVRFTCSIDVKEVNEVQSVRFQVELSSENIDAGLPITFDLYPLEIVNEEKKNVNVKVSPSLNFVDIAEVALGEVAFDINYVNLTPIITASGLQENIFSWDIRKTKGKFIAGGRFLYALLKVPLEAGSVRANIGIVASLKTSRGLFLGSISKKNEKNLSVTICKPQLL